MEIKNGDTVLVRMTVKDMCPMHGPNVRINAVAYMESDKSCLVRREDIVSVEPRPLQVGDKVTWCNHQCGPAPIVAILREEAWLDVGAGGRTIPLSDLERVT